LAIGTGTAEGFFCYGEGVRTGISPAAIFAGILGLTALIGMVLHVVREEIAEDGRDEFSATKHRD
jgi:hypothetical protein